jgi:hypothetical protein
MSVEISVDETAPQVKAPRMNVACIIGRATGIVDYKIIENITSVGQLDTDYGITEATAHTLVASVQSFIDGVTAGGATGIGCTVAVFDAYDTETKTKEKVQETWAEDTLTYHTPDSPIASISSVYLKFGTAFVTQDAAKWDADADDNGIYPGEIVFTGDAGSRWRSQESAEAFLAAGATTDAAAATCDGIYVDYTLGQFDSMLSELLEKDINYIILSFDCTETGMGPTFTYTKSNLINDYLKLKSHSSNAYNLKMPRQFAVVSPAGVEPNELDTGFGLSSAITFAGWKNVLGTQDALPISHNVSVDDNGASLQDPGAFRIGKICAKSIPKEGETLDNYNSLSQSVFPTMGQVDAWTAAQWSVVITRPNIFSTKRLSYGMTFGSDDAARAEYVRALYWLIRNINATMQGLIAGHKIFLNLDGCSTAESAIRGIVGRGAQEGILDGLHSIVFPLKDAFRTSTTATSIATINTAKAARKMGPMTIKWIFDGNVETFSFVLTKV